MDIEITASRESREATEQAIRIESEHHVPTADLAEGKGSDLLGPPAANRHRLPDEPVRTVCHHQN